MVKIGIVGGTGDIGEGFARLGKQHEIRIGSRKLEDAEKAAKTYRENLEAATDDKTEIRGAIAGCTNAKAVQGADIIVLAVPYKALTDTIDAINPYIDENAIVISPIVPMKMNEDKTFDYARPQIGSAAEEVKQRLTKTKKVVAAFHNVPAKRLADYRNPLGCTVAICGEEAESDAVAGLARAMGAEPKYAGKLDKSHQVEGITPFLLNVKECCKSKEPYTIQLIT